MPGGLNEEAFLQSRCDIIYVLLGDFSKFESREVSREKADFDNTPINVHHHHDNHSYIYLYK